jgi:hypothetical protein
MLTLIAVVAMSVSKNFSTVASAERENVDALLDDDLCTETCIVAYYNYCAIIMPAGSQLCPHAVPKECE